MKILPFLVTWTRTGLVNIMFGQKYFKCLPVAFFIFSWEEILVFCFADSLVDWLFFISLILVGESAEQIEKLIKLMFFFSASISELDSNPDSDVIHGKDFSICASSFLFPTK